MKIPRKLSDLTRKDFSEIAATVNMSPGLAIRIEKKGESVVIMLDESQFKRLLWAFNQNGGFSATIDELDEVPLDLD